MGVCMCGVARVGWGGAGRSGPGRAVPSSYHNWRSVWAVQTCGRLWGDLVQSAVTTQDSVLPLSADLFPMAPACALVDKPQCFAVPLAASSGVDVATYAEPLQRLGEISQGLVRYHSPAVLAGFAVVEERSNDTSVWWLVLNLSRPMKLVEFKTWLGRHAPGEFQMDRTATMTPMIQRRFGWGDVRSTPQLLEALAAEVQLPVYRRGDELLRERQLLAGDELLLRCPAELTAESAILRTSMGRHALACKACGDNSPLDALILSVETLVLAPSMAPVPSAQSGGALAMITATSGENAVTPTSGTANAVSQGGARTLPGPKISQMVAAMCHPEAFGALSAMGVPAVDDCLPAPTATQVVAALRQEVEPLVDGYFAILHGGNAPFRIYQSQRPSFDEYSTQLKRELRADVTFARMLVKFLYAVRGVTPPCPALDPQLLLQMKLLWEHELTAADLDMCDAVMGRVVSRRCRVCFKPGVDESGVHSHCQTTSGICDVVSYTGEAWYLPDNLRYLRRGVIHMDADLEPYVRSTGCGHIGSLPPLPYGMSEYPLVLAVPRRCKCNAFMRTSHVDLPAKRPSSTKIARKRASSR